MNARTRAYDSDIQQYYCLARTIQKQDRETAAVNLRCIHQQTVDQVVECVLSLIADSDGDLKALTEDVRNLKLSGKQFATDRMHLRRAEAILNVLSRQKDTVKKRDVEGVFNAGDGVEIAHRCDEIVIKIQPGKFKE